MTSEHASSLILKTIQTAEISNVYPRLILLCGKEEFLVNWAKNYLIDKLTFPASRALDLCVFSEDGIELSAIISACDTMPLMSKRKLVIVENSDLFTMSPKDMDSSSVEKLVKYLPDIPESTTLVFTCGKVNKVKAVYKAVLKLGLAFDFAPLDDQTLGSWVAKRFIAAKKQGSKADFVSFARICGYGDDERNYTLYNLENDLKKAFASYDKEYIGLEDLLAVSQGQGELNAFKLLDSAFSGNKAAAFDILNSTIENEIPSKEMGVVLSFLGLLISQLEIMVEGKERIEGGQSYSVAVKEMGVNSYRFQKAMESCRNKKAWELENALDRAFQIEKDLKLGDINGRTALELFIAKL